MSESGVHATIVRAELTTCSRSVACASHVTGSFAVFFVVGENVGGSAPALVAKLWNVVRERWGKQSRVSKTSTDILGSSRRIGLPHTKTLFETDNISFLLYLGGVVQGVTFLAVVTAYGRSHVVTGVHIGHDPLLHVVGVAIHLLVIVKSIAVHHAFQKNVSISTIAITRYGAIVIKNYYRCVFRTGRLVLRRQMSAATTVEMFSLLSSPGPYTSRLASQLYTLYCR